MAEWEEEKEECEEKKNNFVILGAPLISCSDEVDRDLQKQEDTDLVTKILSEVDADSTDIKNVFRMGNVTKVEQFRQEISTFVESSAEGLFCQEKMYERSMGDHQKSIQRYACQNERKVFWSFYFRDDWTKKQLALHRELVIEKNEKNKNIPEGQPKYKIYKFKVVKNIPKSQEN